MTTGGTPPAQRRAIDLCACGHGAERHARGTGVCCALVGKAGLPLTGACRCGGFTPHPQPGPVAPLPGEVAVALNSNHCERCARKIDIMEPIYRGKAPGRVMCAGCNDALAGRGDPALPVHAPRELVTSVLLRRAAQLLCDRDPGTGDLRLSEHRLIAAELRERAAMLQELRSGCIGLANGDRARVERALLAMGEVRP